MSDDPQLSSAERARYARHLALPDFGESGQRRLKAAAVLCIGAGGLGSPAAMYLAAAGIGRLGIIDPDRVDASNIQRQLLHGTSDVGKKKIESARDTLSEINPHVRLELHDAAFAADNAMEIADGYDIILDGADNFGTRYLANDVAKLLGIPNVHGSIFRFEGQVSVFAPHLGGPCYRCLFPEPPDPGAVPDCAEGGVLGVLPGTVGALQATEAIKLITGIGEPLIGGLLHFDALSSRFRRFELRRDPLCALCGDSPTITEPVELPGYCGVPSGAAVESIPAAELRALLESGTELSLLDVREPGERHECSIPGSFSIPLGELAERLSELPPSRPLYVHCKAGGRSLRAVLQLEAAGLEGLVNVEGGIDAWQEG